MYLWIFTVFLAKIKNVFIAKLKKLSDYFSAKIKKLTGWNFEFLILKKTVCIAIFRRVDKECTLYPTHKVLRVGARTIIPDLA